MIKHILNNSGFINSPYGFLYLYYINRVSIGSTSKIDFISNIQKLSKMQMPV